MESRKLSLGLAAAALVVAVVLFVVLRDSSSDSGGSSTANSVSQPLPTGGGDKPQGGGKPQSGVAVPTIVVRGGEPVGGVRDLSFKQGDDIRFRVKSDVSDEVHMHGYDVLKPIKAGGSVEFDLPATLEGVFEVELEERVQELAEVTVHP